MSPGRAKALNLLLLLFGYGVGQGGLFAAQTLLLGQGNLVLIAEFGKAFYTATLALMIIDFGSTTYLAREAARAPQDDGGGLPVAYWRIAPVRIAVAIAFAAFAAIYAATHPGTFGGNYMAGALPAFLLWSLSLTGVLDGARLSGVNGLAGALSFIASAVGLFLVHGAPLPVAGAVMGSSLSIGCAMSLALQVGALLRAGRRLDFERPSLPDIGHAFLASGGALLSTIPGQLYFRFQIFLCATFLSVGATALFLYGKQLVVAVVQIIGFVRRIEFPELVADLSRESSSVLRDLLGAQRLGSLLAAGASILVAGAGAAFFVMETGARAEAGRAVAIFAPTIFAAALALGFTQALMALGRFRAAAAVMVASTLAAGGVALGLIALGVTGLVVADLVGSAVTIGLVMWLLLKHDRLGGLSR